MTPAPSYAEYSAHRFAQLREGNFAFWVYRAELDCPEKHQDLDRLALSPDHLFWKTYYPPIDDTCGCYVVGASRISGLARLGGDAEKPLPSWCIFREDAP